MPNSRHGHNGRNGDSAVIANSIVMAIESGNAEKIQKPLKPVVTEIEGVGVKIKPIKTGVKVVCPNESASCAPATKFPLSGKKELMMCREVMDQLVQANPDRFVPIKGLGALSTKNGNNKYYENGNGASGAGAQLSFEQVNAYLENNEDLDLLKELKKTLTGRIKTLLGDKPERSYKKKVRNGREYWYAIYWDPINKRKVDEYIGTKPPAALKRPQKV